MEVIIRPTTEGAVRLTAELIADAIRQKPFFKLGLATGATMEAVYSGQLPQKETFSLKGKTLSQVLGWLFDENTGEDDFHGLENARDIVERYSGNLSLSGAPGEVILRMSLRF